MPNREDKRQQSRLAETLLTVVDCGSLVLLSLIILVAVAMVARNLTIGETLAQLLTDVGRVALPLLYAARDWLGAQLPNNWNSLGVLGIVLFCVVAWTIMRIYK